ncbi:MAG: EF-P lysine aminoacylase EpmA [Gammaproteobacteria bacterium]|nr:EF-P lysine aminoacylase EpmA [Gammaproteobacteria bacterium]
MHWQPGASLATLRHRARLLGATRRFFDRHGLLEVETPALVEHAVTDPHLRNIGAELGNGRRLFLHTSPEFHMKRLLAAGAPDIWQLCRVFRDGEAGRRHEPEFTLLEWYRHGFTLEQLAREACDLLLALAQAAEGAGAAPVIGPTPPVWWSYQALFQATLGIDPLTARTDELRDSACQLLGAEVSAELRAGLGDEPTLWLDLLMSRAISQHLAGTGIAVVTGYPAAQAALARLDQADPRVAERFEIFCRGIEVANGYRELADAREQERRFAADREFRARMCLPDVAPDQRLLQALRHGLPDCAGVAVGFDRVVMILLGLATLQEAISFPVLET